MPEGNAKYYKDFKEKSMVTAVWRGGQCTETALATPGDTTEHSKSEDGSCNTGKFRNDSLKSNWNQSEIQHEQIRQESSIYGLRKELLKCKKYIQ